MVDTLFKLLGSRLYWLGFALLGLALEAVALYYQYALGDEPCQVCIHVRIWIAAWILVAAAMYLLPRNLLLETAAHLLTIACIGGLWERSWFLYQLENGRGEGSCEFFLGFPDWFALDRWFPYLFEVRNLCSYTPEVIFGISMAESLLLLATALLPVALLGLYTNTLGRSRWANTTTITD